MFTDNSSNELSEYDSTECEFGNASVNCYEDDDMSIPAYATFPYEVFDYKTPEFIMVNNFRQFLKYAMPIMVGTSFLGNTTVLIIVLQKRNRKYSTSVYIASLALADLFINCGNTLNNWLLIRGYVRTTYSTLDCKLRLLVPEASMWVSVWSLVVVAIERAISVLYPHKIKNICTYGSAKVTASVLWGVSIAIATLIKSAWYYNEDVFNGQVFDNCIMPLEIERIYQTYYRVFLSCMLYMGPYILITASTIVIVSVLFARGSNNTSKKNVRASVTLTLLQVNILFLLTIGPHCIYNLLETFNLFAFADSIETIDISSYKTILRRMLFVDVSVFLSDLNSVLNIFVYFLNSPRFRKDLYKLLRLSRVVSQVKGTVDMSDSKQSVKRHHSAVVKD